jgi:hypothetical protein
MQDIKWQFTVESPDIETGKAFALEYFRDSAPAIDYGVEFELVAEAREVAPC